jgi:protein-ribulosamine 3-kinase
VSFGEHGLKALEGEFTSTRDIHAIVPEFCVEPFAYGTFAHNKDAHFYLSKFEHFVDDKDLLPNPEDFCRHLATLHRNSKSPTGKFGYGCATYNGNIPQDNTWCDRWETSFANGLRHILQVREDRVGPHPPELEKLRGPLFDAVIPRLLRPLESHGRSVKPSLVHGDLWCGNVSVLENSTEPRIYDPASFYAHHECTRCSCFGLFRLRP